MWRDEDTIFIYLEMRIDKIWQLHGRSECKCASVGLETGALPHATQGTLKVLLMRLESD